MKKIKKPTKTSKKNKKEPVTEYFDLGVIMTPEECKLVADQVLEYRDLGIINAESDHRYYKGSHGGIAPISYDFMGKFLPLVRELVGKKVVFANPFCRIYNNGSTLNPHTDRDVLDWTISVCVKTDAGWDWPLKMKTSDKKTISFPTTLGYASLVRGNVYTHWREPLVCEENENVICMFLHYTNPDNPALTQEEENTNGE
jgi:hypothetical protein